MLEEDLDDDTHLCYKCSRTIVGLENYIQHRKSNCATHHSKPQKSLNDDHAYGSYDFNVPNVENYDHEKIRNEEPSKSISDSLGYSYGLGADIFFSSLQLQSISKDFNQSHSSDHHNSDKFGSTSHHRVLTRKATAALMAHSEHDDDWMNNHIESDKLMKAVSDISGNKKVDVFKLMEYHNNESDHDDESSDDETETDDEEYYNVPPRNHTGGKWKPESPLQNIDHPWGEYEPSTSGKWKSTIEEFPAVDTTDYTQALWMTPTYKPNESYMDKIFADQYFCNICNRRLASRLVYERHLKSNFHLKRSQPENDLEEASRPNNDQEKLSKRFVKPSVYLNNEIYDTEFKSKRKTLPTATITSGSLESPSPPKKKKCRNRRRTYFKCDVCHNRLPTHIIGKHLISRYHYQRMMKSPDTSFQIILSNIDKIVIQSPFQCGICRFYATTEEMFMRHWNSEEHLNQANCHPGRFWCIFCKWESESHTKMTQHLKGVTHQETILAINRSVPIIIRKKVTIQCDECEIEFRYNFGLRQHIKAEHTNQTSKNSKPSTASDSYQSKFACGICSKILHSKLSLQKHEMKTHGIKRYFCNPCGLSFSTPESAKKHRVTTEHKVKAAKVNTQGHKNLKRKCEVCGEIFSDLLELKKHLEEKHPDSKHKCSQCGAKFVLSQEVSRHVRDKRCKPVTETKTEACQEKEIDNTIVSSEESVNDETINEDKNVNNSISEPVFIPNTQEIELSIEETSNANESKPEPNVTTYEIQDSIQNLECKICSFT